MVLTFFQVRISNPTRARDMYCFDRQASPVQVSLDDTTLHECANICREAPHCVSFTHNNRYCVLQGSFVPSDTVYCTKWLWDKGMTREASFRL